MASAISSTELLGARLLREIGTEEGSLEEVRRVSLRNIEIFLIDNVTSPKLLRDLRTTTTTNQPNPSRTGIAELDHLWRRHRGNLAIAGRGLPLLYHIVDHMVTGLRGTVALIDVDGRFSPSHLSCELQHVHVFRPTKRNVKVTLESVEGYMLWGEHGSKGREWVGTLVNGGIGGDVMVGWRGWLRVEREEVGGFTDGVSVEEVVGEREKRQEVVDSRGWKGFSEMGNYCWK